MKYFVVLLLAASLIGCNSDNPVDFGKTVIPDPQQQTIDSLTTVVDSLRIELGHQRCLSQQMRLYLPDTARIECGI